MAAEITNPYQPNEPVATPSMLFGRENAADWLERQITSANARTLVVAGPPLIGKTSFARHAGALLNMQAITLLVSLAQVEPEENEADLTINAVLQAVIAQLTPQLHTLNLIQPAQIPSLPQTASVLRWMFNQAAERLGDTRLLLFFDDLHALYRDDMALASGFLSLLAPLLDECPRLHLVFVLSEQALHRLHHPLLSPAPVFTLGPLPTDAALNMVTVPVKNILRYDYGVTKRIVEVNSHHPYYLTLFCHTLLNRQMHDGWVNQRDFDSTLLQILDSPIPPFTRIWEESSPVERAVLSGMAAIQGAHGPLTQQEITRFLQRQNPDAAPHTVQTALQSLAQRGVLRPMGAISYRFHVELLRLWLREHTRLEENIARVDWAGLAAEASPAGQVVQTPPAMQAPRRRSRLRPFLLGMVLSACVLASLLVLAWLGYVDLPGAVSLEPTPTLEPVIFQMETPAAGASATAEASPTPAATPTPTPALVIARPLPAITFMARDREGEGQVWRIYVMNADGTGVTPLTPPDADRTAPVWSPDGDRIAYVSLQDGNREIYVMNADGSNPVNLTRHPADDWTPSWSPDGAQIAFSSLRSGGWEIYVVDVACIAAPETCPDRTTALTSDGKANILPVWSPDGQWMAYNSKASGNWDIYIMQADGSNPRQVTQAPENDLSPAWSPDGSMLAFESNRDGNVEVYVVNADGRNPRNISQLPQANDHGPIWMPDGQRLVFYSNREGNWDIFTTTLDGQTIVNLTNTPDRDEQTPSWRP
ncbi:MAG: hypothetical protein D6784_06515 [Chloroflexi bacterium]|nr:MAG: hypothetical protein D6784_06515 [Chloroflexota bacterium]